MLFVVYSHLQERSHRLLSGSKLSVEIGGSLAYTLRYLILGLISRRGTDGHARYLASKLAADLIQVCQTRHPLVPLRHSLRCDFGEVSTVELVYLECDIIELLDGEQFEKHVDIIVEGVALITAAGLLFRRLRIIESLHVVVVKRA